MLLDDVVEILKRNGSWQAKTAAEQKSWMVTLTEEHISAGRGREDSGEGTRQNSRDESFSADSSSG